MRISDWSSDVCSSDLTLSLIARSPVGTAAAGRRRARRIDVSAVVEFRLHRWSRPPCPWIAFPAAVPWLRRLRQGQAYVKHVVEAGLPRASGTDRKSVV